jgi:hypothetical protein
MKHLAALFLLLPIFFCVLGAPKSKAKAAQTQTEGSSLHETGEKDLGQPLCYAFLKQGNLFVRCNGTLMQITKQGNVNDFAVSQTGTAMAFMRNQGTRKLNDGFGTPIMKLQIILLKKSGEEHALPIGNKFGSLVASCGTALFLYRTTRDLVSGGDLDFEPYFDFRCSSNRQQIAGEVELDNHRTIVTGLPTGNDHSALATGLPPKIWVPDSGAESFAYDISPNGKYVAYHMPEGLCLIENQMTKSCTRRVDSLNQISVSDAGDVLFTTHTGETCRYRDSFHVSLTSRGGYDSAGPCIGVAVLQRGHRSPRLVQPLAWYPQWLTPTAASAVTAWRHHAGA